MRFFAVFILFVAMLNTNIYGENELDNFDTEKIEEAGEDKTGLSFSKLFYKVINGRGDEIFEDIYDSAMDTLLKEIKDNSTYIKSMVIISLLCGILNTVTVDLKDKSVSELVFFTGQILILTVAVTAFKETIEILKNVTDDIINIIAAAIPFMTGVVSATGRGASVLVSGGILTLTTGVLSSIVKGVIVPLIIITTLVRIVNIISNRDMLNKMSELFKEATGCIIKGGGWIFMFLMGFERIGGNTINKFIGGSVKNAVGAVPVIGDVIEGGVDIAANAAGTVASGSGIVIVILLLSAAIVPVIKIFVITAAYKILAAVVEPVCDKGTVEIIDCIGEGCRLIFAALFMIIFMFTVSILILLGGLT